MNKSKLKELGVRLPSKAVKGPNPHRDPVNLKPVLPEGFAKKLNLPKLDLLPNKKR